MNQQINLRLSGSMLVNAKNYAEKHGYANIQDFIKETLREKLYGELNISAKELTLVKLLAKAAEKKNLYGSEDELFRKLRSYTHRIKFS